MGFFSKLLFSSQIKSKGWKWEALILFHCASGGQHFSPVCNLIYKFPDTKSIQHPKASNTLSAWNFPQNSTKFNGRFSSIFCAQNFYFCEVKKKTRCWPSLAFLRLSALRVREPVSVTSAGARSSSPGSFSWCPSPAAIKVLTYILLLLN